MSVLFQSAFVEPSVRFWGEGTMRLGVLVILALADSTAGLWR